MRFIILVFCIGLVACQKTEKPDTVAKAKDTVGTWATKVKTFFDADTQLIGVAIVIGYVAYLFISPPAAILGLAVYLLCEAAPAAKAFPYWVGAVLMFNRNTNIALLLFGAGFVYYSL